MQNLELKKFAEQAAMQERNGLYMEAAKSWQIAYAHAKKEVNSLWCQHRAQFCRRVAVSPF